MRWLLLALGILSNAGASLLVKRAVMQPRGTPSPSEPGAALTSWPFWLGLTLYGGAFLVYAVALTRFPLNVAHPILTSGAIAVVAIGSVVLFDESMRASTIAGILLVVSGVVLISLKTT